MRCIAASALLLIAVVAPSALAATPAEQAARAIESDPVYVHPRAADRLSESERGRVRLAILRHALGRIKVAVLPASAAGRAGGAGGLASQIDRRTTVRGTLIVVAGPAIHAITSYPQSERAVAAIRQGVSRHEGDPLVEQLLAAIPRLGRVDPGPDADVNQDRPQVPPRSKDIPDADDFLDDIGDTFRIGLLIVAAAIALPFVLFALFMVLRVRRGRARDAEVREAGEKSADRQLVELGDDIRSLDIDTSMPNAPRAALVEYEQAIARYDQANELLEGEPSDYRVQQALAAIAAGRRHIEAARQRLG